MLVGEFKHNLDAKGRVFVPAKFRADLGESFIVAKSSKGFLMMMSEDQWDIMYEKIDALALQMGDKETSRWFAKNSMPTEIDTQGRISISLDQRNYAGLQKEISFIGRRKYVEIWSTDVIDQKSDSYDVSKFDAIADTLGIG